MQKIKVLAAAREDMNEGWVWLSDHDFPPRSIVRIKNKSNKKKVFCEALEIDENFLKQYNQPPRININPDESTMVINSWYRKRLGSIQKKAFHELEISEANCWYGKFQACIGHPQVVVRLATWLGIISVGLGILSIM